MVALGALTSFIQGIYDALTLTSSYKRGSLCPHRIPFAISELVQAQGCPIVRLGRVRIRWLNKASFGPSYELRSRISGGFRIPVSLNRPP